MKNVKVKKMTAVAVAGAMGLILQMFDFPLIPIFPFLKLDFSDIPILVNMFVFGPITGVATALIRSLLHLVMKGFSFDNLIGDTTSFFASSIFTVVMYYFVRQGTVGKKVLGLLTSTLSLTVFMAVANYFVITPLYLKAFGLTPEQMLGMDLGNYVLVGVVPFNLIKGVILGVVFLVFHAKLLPWLAKKDTAAQHLRYK